MKKCNGPCGRELDESMFYSGRRRCKDCVNKARVDRTHGIYKPIIKPEFRTCRIDGCGATSDRVEFKGGTNLCMPHWKEWKSQYDKDHRDILRIQTQTWKDNNRDHVKEMNKKNYHEGGGAEGQRNRYEKTVRSFLSKQVSTARSHAINPKSHDPKDVARREFDIDLNYVCGLWNDQKGFCKLKGIRMCHKYGKLNAVSIDRIDSSKGHIKGNIQLVCMGLNRMKNKHTMDEVNEFMRALDQSQAIPCECGQLSVCKDCDSCVQHCSCVFEVAEIKDKHD